MRVRLNSCILRHLHQPTTHNLAVRKRGVVLFAFFWHFEVTVVDCQGIDISGSHLSALEIREQSSSHIDCSYERGAHIATAIRVLPSVFLWYGHQITHTHASLSHNVPQFGQFSIGGSQSLIDGLSQNTINWVFI